MLRAAATLLALALTSALGIAHIKSQQLSSAESLVDDLLQFPAPAPQNMPEGRPEEAKFSWNSRLRTMRRSMFSDSIGDR